jgi:hypothetical protein
MARAKKATEAPTDPLDAMLARLQLSGIRDQLDSLLDEAARANLSARGCARRRDGLQLVCPPQIDLRHLDQRGASSLGHPHSRHPSTPWRDAGNGPRCLPCRFVRYQTNAAGGWSVSPSQ